MTKVYLLKNFAQLERCYANLVENFYSPEKKILIKMHFGEPGNNFAFTPMDIAPVINALKSDGLKPVLFDTPVAYDSPRNTVEGYEKVAREKGFENLAPLFVSNRGVEIPMKDLKIKVCQEIMEAENLLVLSRVKGHESSGFGGAIKNFGMGCATKETKEEIHKLSKPKLTGDCLRCGRCIEVCPMQAISLTEAGIKIDKERCCGCSVCQLHCSNNCLVPEKAIFDDLLGQSAAAVIKNLKAKTFYINIIKNITAHCDCYSDPGKIIACDVGVLFSDNPFAIDKASVDLTNERNGKNLFRELHHKDPLAHVLAAAEYANGSVEYDLVQL